MLLNAKTAHMPEPPLSMPQDLSFPSILPCHSLYSSISTLGCSYTPTQPRDPNVSSEILLHAKEPPSFTDRCLQETQTPTLQQKTLAGPSHPLKTHPQATLTDPSQDPPPPENERHSTKLLPLRIPPRPLVPPHEAPRPTTTPSPSPSLPRGRPCQRRGSGSTADRKMALRRWPSAPWEM